MKKVAVSAMALAIALGSLSPALAKGKPTDKPTPSASESATTASTTPSVSAWVSPKGTAAEPKSVKPGATIALKFRLFNGGTAVKVAASSITVSLQAAACTSFAAGEGTLSPVLPGKSKRPDNKTFKLAGSLYSYQWKLPKTAKPGCYKFTATGGGASLTDLFVRVR